MKCRQMINILTTFQGFRLSPVRWYPNNRPFWIAVGLFLRRTSCSCSEIICYDYWQESKAHFHTKGSAPFLALKERLKAAVWKWHLSWPIPPPHFFKICLIFSAEIWKAIVWLVYFQMLSDLARLLIFSNRKLSTNVPSPLTFSSWFELTHHLAEKDKKLCNSSEVINLMTNTTCL